MENMQADELDQEILELSLHGYLKELYDRRAFTLWKHLVDNSFDTLVDTEDPEYSQIEIRRFYKRDSAQ